MARPKTKSALVQGITELVESLRNIEAQLISLSKNQKQKSGRGPGRPKGSKKGPGRPKSKPSGRSKRRGRGRPPGSKNKK
jgi:hypothetical protein